MHKGEKPKVVAGAYTNSVKGTKETALYDIDGTIGALVKQAPPNDGILNAIGKLGVKADNVRVRHLVGRQRQERSLADGRRLRCYSVDLATGKATAAAQDQGRQGRCATSRSCPAM